MSFEPKEKKPKKKDDKKVEKPKQLSDADMDKVAGGRKQDSDGTP
jgi:hypothetical protein